MLTQLPRELQLRILGHFQVWNTTPDEFDMSVHRQKMQRKTLSACIRVSKDWYKASKPILWSDPFLETLEEFILLLKSLSVFDDPPMSNGRHIRRLYLKRFSVPGELVSLISKHCLNLKVLHIRLGMISPEVLETVFKNLNFLESLYLDNLHSAEDSSLSSPQTLLVNTRRWKLSPLEHTRKVLHKITHLDLYLGKFSFFELSL